ncbi:hypothetical protein EJ06DRAFT_16288 [Trichodelitschia bisporula]|uniref:Uncharacterized protein n=1 Tax=Trichodelitschia bisporula TaxID=703511 RepID=A0A6G1IB25_9PEZI|nr:hypothetical protein EJ06DRAFT_16288 [Trichodelitschia bisporula]
MHLHIALIGHQGALMAVTGGSAVEGLEWRAASEKGAYIPFLASTNQTVALRRCGQCVEGSEVRLRALPSAHYLEGHPS